MAPTVLRDGAFRFFFFFFFREEPRLHVHVSHPSGEARFWLTPHVHLAAATGLDDRLVREAQTLVETHFE